jgi:hypothetical protein
VADEAVGTAGDAEGAEGYLLDLVVWDAGVDGRLVEGGYGFLSGQVNYSSSLISLKSDKYRYSILDFPFIWIVIPSG